MKTLKELYMISAPTGSEQQMARYITSYLEERNVTVTRDKAGNLYAVKGVSDTFPCIVAHMDEVHDFKSKSFEVQQIGQVLFGFDLERNLFEGIGADDKNGIWIALRAFEDYDVLKGAFFVSEETGCVGSREADMPFFDDCRFVLQCDRRGNSDFITTASSTVLCSKEFIDAVSPLLRLHGYKRTTGMMTDVMQLKENYLPVSACNISCGYYNPHEENEYTNIDDLYNCLEFVYDIIDTCEDTYWHTYEKEVFQKGKYGRAYAGDFYSDYEVPTPSPRDWDKWEKEAEVRDEYANWAEDEQELDTEWNEVRYWDMISYVEDCVLNHENMTMRDIYLDLLGLYPSATEAEMQAVLEDVTGSTLTLN